MSLRCGSLPSSVSETGTVGSPAPVTRMARVHVAAARERVADGAAHAGGGTAEGPDLGRVVVGLVLKQEQPVWSSPSTSTFTLTVQALISDSSTSVMTPVFLRYLAPMVPMSMRQTGLASRPSSWRISM